jgi:hypothetical protein
MPEIKGARRGAMIKVTALNGAGRVGGEAVRVVTADGFSDGDRDSEPAFDGGQDGSEYYTDGFYTDADGCGRDDEYSRIVGSETVPFERIRRITGYLVGTLDRFNNAKRAEERERVKHGFGR